MNARELKKWIKEKVSFQIEHSSEDWTFRCRLDDNFAVLLGWSGGFDPEQEVYIHFPEDPTYCLSIKIAENVLDDYEWVYMPWDVKTEEVWDTDTVLYKKEDYYETAKWLLKSYREMRKALSKGEITF